MAVGVEQVLREVARDGGSRKGIERAWVGAWVHGCISGWVEWKEGGGGDRWRTWLVRKEEQKTRSSCQQCTLRLLVKKRSDNECVQSIQQCNNTQATSAHGETSSLS